MCAIIPLPYFLLSSGNRSGRPPHLQVSRVFKVQDTTCVARSSHVHVVRGRLVWALPWDQVLEPRGTYGGTLGQFRAVTSRARAFGPVAPQGSRDSAAACSDFLPFGVIDIFQSTKEKATSFAEDGRPGRGCVSHK